MIKRITEPPKLGFGGIAVCRISALFNTYGERTELYIQEINGEITALFAGYQSGFSLTAKEKADFAELDGFFALLNAEVFCDAPTASKLRCQNRTECNIMRFKGLADKEQVRHSKISEVYGALKRGADGDIELPEFDLWYTDFCLRFNHNAAEYALTDSAVAVCGFMTKQASLITGVAVDPKLRGKGHGKATLMSLISAIKEKYDQSEIYTAATDDKVPFYEKCGFEPQSKCAVLRYGSV